MPRRVTTSGILGEALTEIGSRAPQIVLTLADIRQREEANKRAELQQEYEQMAAEREYTDEIRRQEQERIDQRSDAQAKGLRLDREQRDYQIDREIKLKGQDKPLTSLEALYAQQLRASGASLGEIETAIVNLETKKRKPQKPEVIPNFVSDIQTAFENRRAKQEQRKTSYYKQPGTTQEVIDRSGGDFKRFTEPVPGKEFPEDPLTLDDFYNQQYRSYLGGRYGEGFADSVGTDLGVSGLLEQQQQGGYGPDGSFPTEEEYLDAKRKGLAD